MANQDAQVFMIGALLPRCLKSASKRTKMLEAMMDTDLSVTEVAKEMSKQTGNHYTAIKVNKMLCALDYQIRTRKSPDYRVTYYPTDKTNDLGIGKQVLVPGQRKVIKWDRTIIETLIYSSEAL